MAALGDLYDLVVRLSCLVILAGCGRIGFGIGGAPGPGGDAHGDGPIAGGEAGEPMVDALMSPLCGTRVILADDFSDGIVANGPWTKVVAGSMTFTEAQGNFQIAVASGAPANQHGGIRQTASESFTGVCAIAELVTAPVQGVHAYVRLGTETNHVEMYVTDGQLWGVWTDGGTTGTNGPIAYDPVAYRFLRIREQASNYHFEMGPSLTSFPSTLGEQGGAIVQPGPSSFEIGAETSTAPAAATTAGFDSAVLLGP